MSWGVGGKCSKYIIIIPPSNSLGYMYPQRRWCCLPAVARLLLTSIARSAGMVSCTWYRRWSRAILRVTAITRSRAISWTIKSNLLDNTTWKNWTLAASSLQSPCTWWWANRIRDILAEPGYFPIYIISMHIFLPCVGVPSNQHIYLWHPFFLLWTLYNATHGLLQWYAWCCLIIRFASVVIESPASSALSPFGRKLFIPQIDKHDIEIED